MADHRVHTEFNHWLFVVLTWFVILIGGLMAWAGELDQPAAWIPLGIVTLINLLLMRTVVSVSANQLSLRFFFPIPRRTIQAEDVERFSAVSVPWWVGWGFRMAPGRCCWRAAGTRAVQFEFRQGPKFWLGCKDPEAVIERLRSQPEWANRYSK